MLGIIGIPGNKDVVCGYQVYANVFHDSLRPFNAQISSCSEADRVLAQCARVNFWHWERLRVFALEPQRNGRISVTLGATRVLVRGTRVAFWL